MYFGNKIIFGLLNWIYFSENVYKYLIYSSVLLILNGVWSCGISSNLSLGFGYFLKIETSDVGN